MSVREEGTIGKCTVGGKTGGRREEGRNMRNSISHSLTNYTLWNSNKKNTIILLAAFVYVVFRSSRPDKETMKKVMKELQDNNIDVSQLVEFSADHCQQLESPTARRSCK
jgi:hypothetical protein